VLNVQPPECALCAPPESSCRWSCWSGSCLRRLCRLAIGRGSFLSSPLCPDCDSVTLHNRQAVTCTLVSGGSHHKCWGHASMMRVGWHFEVWGVCAVRVSRPGDRLLCVCVTGVCLLRTDVARRLRHSRCQASQAAPASERPGRPGPDAAVMPAGSDSAQPSCTTCPPSNTAHTTQLNRWTPSFQQQQQKNNDTLPSSLLHHASVLAAEISWGVMRLGCRDHRDTRCSC
jgi:hypothetical protein